MIKLIVVLVLVSSVIQTHAKIPSFIKTCKSTDPKLGECIKSSMHDLRQHLQEGIPELGVPSLKTVNVGDVHVTSNLNLNITDMTFYNLGSNFEVQDLSANFAKQQYALITTFTNITFTGNYAIDTKILVIPLEGHGPVSGSFGSFVNVAKFKGRKFTKEGKEYVKFTFSEYELTQFKDVKLRLDNLFPNSKELAQAAKDVVEDNAAVLIDDLLPFLKNVIRKFVTELWNKVTTKTPLDELFPLD